MPKLQCGQQCADWGSQTTKALEQFFNKLNSSCHTWPPSVWSNLHPDSFMHGTEVTHQKLRRPKSWETCLGFSASNYECIIAVSEEWCLGCCSSKSIMLFLVQFFQLKIVDALMRFEGYLMMWWVLILLFYKPHKIMTNSECIIQYNYDHIEVRGCVGINEE